MMTMKKRSSRCFGGEWFLIMLFASSASIAQEAESIDDDIGPAVDTSAIELDDTSATEGNDAEIDAMEPVVSAPLISEDVTRSTRANRVMDSIELGRTEITGNQELPKVLYIVPWQKSDPGDLMGRPVNSLLDEVLAPVDREEFVRQVGYYDDLYGSEDDSE